MSITVVSDRPEISKLSRVPVFINGRRYSALVVTGGYKDGMNILSARLYHEFFDPMHKQVAVDDIIVPNFKFCMGANEYKSDVCVWNVDDDMWLGCNFLVEQHLVLDIRSGLMRHEEFIPWDETKFVTLRGRTKPISQYPESIVRQLNLPAEEFAAYLATQNPSSVTDNQGATTGDLEALACNNPKVSSDWMAKMLTSGSTQPSASQAGPSQGKANTLLSTDAFDWKRSMDIDGRNWANPVTREWENKGTMKTKFPAVVKNCFDNVSCPHAVVLYLVENSRDYHVAKGNTLSFAIMKEFDAWLKNHSVNYILDSGIKTYAFRTFSTPHMTMLDLAVKSFKLNQAGNDYLLHYVHDWFWSKKKIKEAAQVISRLNLHHAFDIKDIALPLLLQDNINLVENYVFKNKVQQEALLKFLDKLCDRSTDISQVIRDSGLKVVRTDKLQYRQLSKLAVRLMKKYQIPPEKCPNINNARSLAALRYVLYKRYIEKTAGQEIWDELVQSTVGDNKWLQAQLPDQLVSYHDIPEAVRWARHYNVPESELPYQVTEALPTTGSCLPVGESEDWDAECAGEDMPDPRYHCLRLPPDAIVIVNTREQLQTCLDHLTQPGTVIGLDGEWKPTLTAASVQRIAVLQLAVHDRVYLLDMIALATCLSDDDWAMFAVDIFANENLLKLGYGFDSDLQMLSKTFPAMMDALNDLKRVVDLQVLQNQIQTAMSFDKLNQEGATGGAQSDMNGGGATYNKDEEKGLSELSRRYLGKPLRKVEQMSDWERRPLRQAQVLYAARSGPCWQIQKHCNTLDAYCLLEIYDLMVKIVHEKRLAVHLEPKISVKWKSKQTRQQRLQKKVAEKVNKPAINVPIENPLPINRRPIRPQDFRVVVDTMLQGLGRQLRCCGVDVKMLENHQDHDQAAFIAQKEERIILTAGTPYYTLKSYVPEGCCMSVRSTTAHEQVSEVLQHYNVKVTERDIFSRCQVCNGNEYTKVSQADIIQALTRKEQLMSNSCSPNSNHSLRQTDKNSHSRSGKKYQSPQRVYGPRTMASSSGINMNNVTVGDNIPLKVEDIDKRVLPKIQEFFCCVNCGKVFWEGTHFDRVCQQFAHVLTPSASGQ